MMSSISSMSQFSDHLTFLILKGGFWLFFGLPFYFLPTIVAFVRGVTNKGGIILLDIFLGWTVIGWLVALIMAFSMQTNRKFRG